MRNEMKCCFKALCATSTGAGVTSLGPICLRQRAAGFLCLFWGQWRLCWHFVSQMHVSSWPLREMEMHQVKCQWPYAMRCAETATLPIPDLAARPGDRSSKTRHTPNNGPRPSHLELSPTDPSRQHDRRPRLTTARSPDAASSLTSAQSCHFYLPTLPSCLAYSPTHPPSHSTMQFHTNTKHSLSRPHICSDCDSQTAESMAGTAKLGRRVACGEEERQVG